MWVVMVMRFLFGVWGLDVGMGGRVWEVTSLVELLRYAGVFLGRFYFGRGERVVCGLILVEWVSE
jgi:hypothetical protein